ncbi:hypothetical protein O59_000751 [Cellvibrio sp. BR]|nr:hypothetical protein O59_000751 [Cellvibrio sp. BR]
MWGSIANLSFSLLGASELSTAMDAAQWNEDMGAMLGLSGDAVAPV